MGFTNPEIDLLLNTPEQVQAARAYVTRRAPDLLEVLGLQEPEPAGEETVKPGSTHCYKGHAFTEGNTIWRKDSRGGYTRRRCRICKNNWASGKSRVPQGEGTKSQ